ncbi:MULTISPECIES: DMT family transporter [Nocardia]|uniref:DMT family transporter n=1 Tax=Nocardia TaxID=1817 RepID=UPI001894458C|nr:MULTISPECIES: DMT family transporter [Nocardia]MBF6350031.1 DMT family transporter [Nocardia flavorosea]
MVLRRSGLGLGLLIGAGVAVQGRINGELGARLADGIAAAVVSFGTGFVLLLVAVVLSARLRAGLRGVRVALAAGELRYWQLLGGLCGALFVASQSLTVAAVGVTAFTVGAVSGQLVSSLVVDRLGIGPQGRTPVTAARLGGAVLAVGAVLLAASGGPGTAGAATASWLGETAGPVLLILPVLAGVGLAWQQAWNGRVGTSGSPFAATVINFGIGLLGLLAVEALVLVRVGPPAEFPREPWLYLGGALGVLFIAAGVLVVRWVGVLLMGLSTVAGQLTTSVLLDWLLPAGAGLSPAKVAGCGLTLAAVVVATLQTGRCGLHANAEPAQVGDRTGGSEGKRA